MRKLLIIISLICLLFSSNAKAASDTYSQLNQEQEQSQTSDLDEELEELTDPSKPQPQPNGSDIPAEKVYTQAEYEQIYRDLEVPTFTFIHGVDPDQYYDLKDAAWSPYPLMRLNSPIYFKSITIEPGYYLLTPRQYKGDWYILFKEAGKVKYTIPVFEKNYTDPMYYQNNLKEVDMKRSQRWMVKFLNGVGKYFKRSKRKPPIKTNLELTDLDNKFLLIEVYYGSMRYKTIFRTEKF